MLWESVSPYRGSPNFDLTNRFFSRNGIIFQKGNACVFGEFFLALTIRAQELFFHLPVNVMSEETAAPNVLILRGKSRKEVTGHSRYIPETKKF